MKISIFDRDYIIIYTRNGFFHVSEEGDKTKIAMYDHFNMEIEGNHKRCPKITLDSDEFRTRLELKQTESKWEGGPLTTPQEEL